MLERKPIKPEHKKLLDRIRELYIQSGGKLSYEPEDFGLNNIVKTADGIEIDFDYGVPGTMYTPEGSYEILGSHVVGDTDMFWELFNQEFNVEILIPQRDDSKTSYIAYQLQVSGPRVRISTK